MCRESYREGLRVADTDGEIERYINIDRYIIQIERKDRKILRDKQDRDRAGDGEIEKMR